MAQDTKIFISYRRDDCLDEARTIYRCFRDAFGPEQLDPFFDEKTIALTEDWKQKLRYALEQSEIMLCLIGPKWVASFENKGAEADTQKITDWVRYEIETALDEHIDIIPIFLRKTIHISRHDLPKSFPQKIAKILDRQGFPIKEGELEPRTSDIIASIRQLIEDNYHKATSGRMVVSLKPLASLPLPDHYIHEKLNAWDEKRQKPKIEQPFLGPVFYHAEHAALFFGRDKEIRDLYHLIRRKRIVLVNGYSGTGKSSLLNAGLIPRMENVPGWNILAPVRRSKQLGGLHRQLRELKKSEAFPKDKRTLLILDQVEEMYTDPLDGASSDVEITEFGTLLYTLLEQIEGLHVILAFRSEYEPRITNEFLPKYRLLKSTGELYLHPLREEGIIDAIKGPMKYEVKFKFEVSDAVAKSIAKDFVGDRPGPYAVLLQIQLVELWKAAKQLKNSRKIVFTQALYEQHRRDDLEKYIEDQLEELKKDPAWKGFLNKGLGLDILYGYTTSMGTATGYEDLLFYEKYQHIDGLDLKPLLNAFKRCYLLQTTGQRSQLSKLTHDTLAPIIRKKYNNSDAPAQRAQRIVETKAREIKQGFPTRFSETDIETIVGAQQAMQKVPEEVLEKMKDDQKRYEKQKQDRFHLAFDTAAKLIENLNYEDALNRLRVASYERIHWDLVYELAAHLPFYFKERAQSDLLRESLQFLQRLSEENDTKLETMLLAVGNSGKDKSQLKKLLKDWNPILFQEMEEHYFPTMLEITGGRFAMGSEEGYADEKPIHEVSVSSFQLADTPVTCWQYGLFCQETEKALPNDSGFGRGDKPVVNVNWIDAVKYCNWLSKRQGLDEVYTIDPENEERVSADREKSGYRLPTEAEWEYAAREGGKDIRFGNGKNVADPAEMNFDASHPYNRQKPNWYIAGKGYGGTTPVKKFAPNALDLYDMSGNVFEWCWDKWSEGKYYKQSEGAKNPTGPEETSEPSRVVRGGSWHGNASDCRCSYRYRGHPINQNIIIGFRVARRL